MSGLRQGDAPRLACPNVAGLEPNLT